MLQIQENVPLAPYSTYKVGGPAKKFVVVHNIEELQEALVIANQNHWPTFVLAGGSNIIISSKGVNGLVIKVEIATKIVSGTRIICGAGATIAELIEMAQQNGLAGLEWAGGLPGSLGGAVRGNAGAFGGEIKDTVDMVISADKLTGRAITRSNRQCGFNYRTSIFKDKDNEVIISVSLKLRKGNPEELHKIAQDHITYRQEKHPMEYPSAGSVFKNVAVASAPPAVVEQYRANIKTDPFPVIPTAKLIADAGLSGLKQGGAQISPKHTNYIVNVQGATGEDILELIKVVRRTIREKFGVILDVEQQLVGF